jgi:membrane protease YdiL (CAAX protease family)
MVAIIPAIDARAATSSPVDALAVFSSPYAIAGLVWTLVALFILKRTGSLSNLGKSRRTTSACTPVVWIVLAMVLFLASTVGSSLAAIVAGISNQTEWTHKESAILSTGSYLLGGLVCLVMAILVQRRDANSGLGGSVRGVRSGVLIAVLMLPTLWFLSIVFVGLTLLLGFPTPDAVAHSTLSTLLTTGHDVWWWLLLAGAVLGAPIVEEYLFRGVLQAGLLEAGLGVVPTVLITSVGFTLLHLSAIPVSAWPVALPTLFGLSGILGLLMERTGSIAAPVLMHSLFNVMNLGIAFAGGGS